MTTNAISIGRAAPFFYAMEAMWEKLNNELIARVVKAVEFTINLDANDTDDDFQLDNTPVNATEQPLDLGAVIPANASILSAQIKCIETVDGSGDLTMGIDLGVTTGAGDVLATGNTDAANDINSSAAAASPEIAALKTAKNIWANFKPTANWSTLTAGRWSIVIVYIDYEMIHTE